MQPTIEARWWSPGTWPGDVRGWFTGLGAQVDDEARTDHYLRIADRPGIGVKARAGELLEVKVRRARLPAASLARGVTGHLERWRKWSFPVVSDEPGVADLDVTPREWVAAAKHRWRLMIGGCEVELAEVRIAGAPWRSLGAEALDDGDGDACLRKALAQLVSAGLTRHVTLDPGASHGYPAQLLAVTARPDDEQP